MEISAQNASFTVNGTYCGGDSYGVIVLGTEDPGFSGLKRSVHDIPGIHGAELEGGYLQGAKWTIPCLIQGDSESAVHTKLENLLYLLNSDLDLPLIFDSRPDVYWLVSATEPSAATWSSAQQVLHLNLALTLADPVAFAVDATESPETIAGTPHAFTVATGNGGVSPHVEWVIAPTADLTSITLANATTGETCTYTKAIANGTYLKLDSALQEVFTSPDGVNWTRNVPGSSGDIPRLSPRVTNNLTLTGVPSGTITATFRERYAGIVR